MTIKELRLETGLSQADFAEKFHIKKGTLTNWEQGIRKPPEHIPYMIETILKQEKVLDNIYVRLLNEKYKDRSKYYSDEICLAGRNAFNTALDIVEDEKFQLLK